MTEFTREIEEKERQKERIAEGNLDNIPPDQKKFFEKMDFNDLINVINVKLDF